MAIKSNPCNLSELPSELLSTTRERLFNFAPTQLLSK